MIRSILFFLNLIVLIGAVIWSIKEPGFEPYIVSVVALTSLIGVWYTDEEKLKGLIIKLKAKKGSKNMVAGGDIDKSINTNSQFASENSQNYNANVITINQGFGFDEAQKLMSELFKSNFPALEQQAMERVNERVLELSNEFFHDLKQKNPDGVMSFNDPGVQNSFLQIQKAYALSGDKGLIELLINLMIDRTTIKERNIKQIVLEEAIHVVPKLTKVELDIICINFILKRTYTRNIQSLNDFKKYLEEKVIVFSKNISYSSVPYRHLEYLGCGYLAYLNHESLEKLFRNKYTGIFSRGFSKKEFEQTVGLIDNYKDIIIPCLHDSKCFQIGCLSNEVLEKMMFNMSISLDDQQKIESLFHSSTMDTFKIRELISSQIREMNEVFDFWDKTLLGELNLSPVGEAIAHAKIKATIGETFNLDEFLK